MGGVEGGVVNHQAIAAGQWIPQCSAAALKSVSTNLTKRNFFLIGFRLTGPRGGRFSPAADVITS
jgi:hypothetical protein